MRKKKKDSLLIILILAVLLVVGFFYRIYGLSANYPFWIDEFSTGQFAAAIVESGYPQTVTGYFETRNLLNHYLTAFSMKFLGVNEFAARFPSVIWGTLTILVVFLVFSRLFNKRIGLGVAILTTFSVIEITWSRQARSYALLQLAYLITAYFLCQLFEKMRKEKVAYRDLIIPALFLIISLLAHLWAATLVLAGVAYIIFFARKDVIRFLRHLTGKQKIITGLIFLVLFWLLWQSGLGTIFEAIVIQRELPLKIYNNFWYYHSFLWRQYSLVSFLAFLGILLALSTKEKKHFFLVTVLATHLVAVIFFFSWLDVRYLYPIFPIFFFAYLVYFLDNVSRWWLRKSSRLQVVLLFFFVCLLVINGHKFTFKPRLFYSPNADMKQIPLVDYHLAYDLIKKQNAQSDQPVVVIDTWGDKIVWYLGRDYPNAFWIRQAERLSYRVERGEKRENTLSFGAITDKNDLLQVIRTNPKGFVFIDGHEIPFLPKDALEHIENNLQLEIEFSRFSLDPDPYDTWPAWLYSWGN
ncbi:glycosyltransferase family 39 protein [Patescibacteria group bacterium]|nr:glycosyltransferase family 39 protein [Patescibacteria group bacterium]